jgi:hypothetical protein
VVSPLRVQLGLELVPLVGLVLRDLQEVGQVVGREARHVFSVLLAGQVERERPQAGVNAAQQALLALRDVGVWVPVRERGPD